MRHIPVVLFVAAIVAIDYIYALPWYVGLFLGVLAGAAGTTFARWIDR